MAVSESYREYVREQFEQVADVQMRSMFGGIGVFDQGRMFAMISSSDRLYLKVDESTQPDYMEAGMEQFMNMPYYELPGEVLEDVEVLWGWIEKAKTVAARQAEKTPKRKK